MSEIYSPDEDSFLMSDILKKEIPKLLKKNSDLKFLEIGSGSGVNLKIANESGIKKKNIFSCDVNQRAVKLCKSLGFNCIKSDLFENIKGKFDLIIFNPPYLPENKFDKERDTSGGKKGDETILEFLKQAKKYLCKKGKIFLLTSSFTPMSRIRKEMKNYKHKILVRKKLFYEELFVWELM
ncbi:MAG: methyltransferase [Nanoarchaeota archaeon]|nr:methyltransferase [Nanoarchaeota archaeon]